MLYASRFQSTCVALVVIGVFVMGMPTAVYAELEKTFVAKTYVISGAAPVSGDVVAFDRATQTFVLSQKANDADLLGVVQTDPAVVLRTTTAGVPVVVSGEVLVNVTTVNGSIQAGDYLTSSSIAGKAQKANSNDAHILGTALRAFPGTLTNTSPSKGPEDVYSGTVPVLLTIGSKESGAVAGGSSGMGAGSIESVTGVSAPVSNLIKYLLAAIVVIGSIYISFRNFGSNMKDSIVSVGRNPLAKASIQSMVVLNTVLVVLIAASGIFIGLMILFVSV